MYAAEVLSKFPVVQHFRFGSLFKWEADPNAVKLPASIHTSSQPSKAPISSSISNITTASARTPATSTLLTSMPRISAPWAHSSNPRARSIPLTGSARSSIPQTTLNTSQPPAGESSHPSAFMPPPTKAPWTIPPS